MFYTVELALSAHDGREDLQRIATVWCEREEFSYDVGIWIFKHRKVHLFKEWNNVFQSLENEIFATA